MRRPVFVGYIKLSYLKIFVKMRIAIDIRSLLEPCMSGIGEYSYNVLKRILEADKENQFNLFYNIRHSVKTKPPKFDYPNVKTLGYQYPNRWLNLSLRYFGRPRLEKLSGDPDLMWFPNFGFMNFNIKVPYVLTVHDLSFERYPEFFTPAHRLWHKLIDCRRMARGAAKIIAVSENTKNDLIELYGISNDKIDVIYEGVGEEYFKETEKLSHSTNSGQENKEIKDDANMRKVVGKYDLPEEFILFLGTIEPRKNIEAIIRAFDKVCNTPQAPSLKLILAGGKGWNNEQIYDIYKQAKHRDKIKFIGYVDKEDKPALYSLASLFVFPSIYEGFGLPPLEAMACGTAVIASNASSLPEVVEDAGLLVDPYNVNELAEAMRVMLGDDKLRQDFIEKGREQVKKFLWRSCADRTLEVINRVGGLF
ncbi:glycosyltransferase family 4 protein [Patescibacteria group bacterium]|nr:glycosyltransferase family 4 protein [Patescibacteria group bacterium]MBU4512163.1 glycosyltransferase family 4 protein [Patescibacteria group bacterium]MCG2693033.1 glycosyltransferase family 4 protein [Candidatus Parcubacteria bacterium]